MQDFHAVWIPKAYGVLPGSNHGKRGLGGDDRSRQWVLALPLHLWPIAAGYSCEDPDGTTQGKARISKPQSSWRLLPKRTDGAAGRGSRWVRGRHHSFETPRFPRRGAMALFMELRGLQQIPLRLNVCCKGAVS